MVLRSKDYIDKDRLRRTRNKQRKRYYKKTQIYKARKWTSPEINLIMDPGLTDHELSKLLKRSVQSIQTKRHSVKAEIQ